MIEKTSFYRGAALSATQFATLGAYDKHTNPYFPDTQVAIFDVVSGWEQVKRWNVFGTGLARFEVGAGGVEAVVLSETGEVIFTRSPDTIECVSDAVIPATSGPSVVQGRVFVVGAAGAHFMRDRTGQWAPLLVDAFDAAFLALSPVEQAMEVMGFSTIDEYDAMSLEQTVRSAQLKADRTRMFYSIGGSAPDDLYLVGSQGSVLHFNGTAYTPIELSEKSNLTRVSVHDGQVYLAGAHRGTVIYRGSVFGGFERIFDASTKTLYLDTFTHFGGAIFIGDPQDSTGGLYELSNGELRKHQNIKGPVWAVDAIDGVLWVMQSKSIHRYDGVTWDTFESPFV